MDIKKVNENRVSDGVNGAQDLSKTGNAQKAKNEKLHGADSVKQSKTPEKVQWSSDAEVALEGLNAVKSAEVHQKDKVETLKAAIKNGTYKPDATKIADSMIQKTLEDGLLSRKG